MRTLRSSRWSGVLLVLAVPVAIAGIIAAYVRVELADEDRFANRAVAAVRSDEARGVIAEQLAVGVLERGSPDLVASRPLVLAAVEAVLDTESFGRVLRRTAVVAHRLLLEGESDVVVELQAVEVLRPSLQAVAPEVARSLPADVSPRIAEIRRSDVGVGIVRVAHGSAVAAPLLVLLALGLVSGGVALAPNRQRALTRAGMALVTTGVGGLVLVAALRAQVVSRASEVGVIADDDARAAAGAVWDGLVGGLDWWFLLTGVAGIALVAATVLARARVDRAGALRSAADALAGGNLRPGGRLLRGALLVGLGLLVALGDDRVRATVVLVVGGGLAILGLAEVVAVLSRSSRHVRTRGPGRRTLALAGAAVLVAAGVGTAVLVAGDDGADPPAADEITACNGSPALCDRRLDEVVLAGTHNSMSAADRPGWFFANQRHAIPRQLRDGIRLLMIDPHYGVADARGRIRTDLAAEGTTRNRVAAQLGAESTRAAEQLAGRLGLVPSDGKRGVYLCHSLCELGAEPIGRALKDVRGFLERNRAEVVVLFVESSVEPDDVREAFEKADLEPYLAALPRDDQPLPTLREMVASGRRLVVLDQGDGGEAAWHQPGFLFVQDTKVNALDRSATACPAGRGTPESPLVWMNHWIDRFPPPADANRAVGDRETLLRRVEACRSALGRAPNAIAVDFYDSGDVVDVVRTLNERAAP